MILEPADESCNELDALRLFLGSDPLRMIGRPPGQCRSQDLAHPLESVGSILVLAGSDADTAAERLPSLLADCRSRLSDDGRIAVLAGNRLRLVMSALRARDFTQGEVAGEPWWRQGFSANAILAMVRRAGYEDIALFAVSPSREMPSELRPSSLADRLAAPAFLVTAGKSSTPDGFLLRRAMTAIEGERSIAHARAPATLSRVVNSSRGKSIAIVEQDRARSVIRIARSATMREDESVSYGIIGQLQANQTVGDLVPRPLGQIDTGGFAFFAQSGVPGTPLYTRIRGSNRAHYVREVERFLLGMNADLIERPPVALDSDMAASNIQPMVDFALSHLEDSRLRAVATTNLEEALAGAVSRLGTVHGDFGTANILVDQGRITGVIDWEAVRPWGPPVLDAFNYLDTAHQSCRGNVGIVATLPLLASDAWPVAEEARFLRSMFDFCDIDVRYRRGFALLYALFHIGPQLRFAHADGPRRRLEQVVRWFVDR